MPFLRTCEVRGPVAGYRALPSELDVLPLLQKLHAEAFDIALPCMADDRALVFRKWTPGAALQTKRFGVEEPAWSEPELSPAIVLVPLVAFDRTGTRLGYGAGYYDAGLRGLRARGPVLAIGIAFDEQEFSSLPREAHDEPLDSVLTPSRFIVCKD